MFDALSGGGVRLAMAGWLVLSVHGLAAPAYAQYRFDSWTVDDGLPQNVIVAIHHASDGYLWVVTLDGVARFDGARFTVFNRSRTPGIENNRFTSLYEDGQGDLWLGTEGGLVTRYTGGRFVSLGPEHGLLTGGVGGFTSDDVGNLWAHTGGTIRKWLPSAERFEEVPSPEVNRPFAPMVWGSRGGFWSTSEQGLVTFVAGRWSDRRLPAGLADRVHYVGQSSDGAIWIAGPDFVGRLAPEGSGSGDEALEIWPLAKRDPSRPGPDITWRDGHGQVWTLAVGERLRQSLTLSIAGEPETVTFTSLHEDRQGNLWLGTDGRGLYRVRRQAISVYSQPQGLVARNVYPIFQDRSGAIWIGAWTGGLSRFKDGSFTNYTIRDALGWGAVTAITEDREGRLWLGGPAGVQTFYRGRFAEVPLPLDTADPTVYAIHEDSSGAMWFGTDLGVIQLKDGEATRFTSADGLAGNSVRVIIGAAAGGLWLGGAGGLTRYQDGRFTPVAGPDGQPMTMVRALYEDSDGVLWIGTYDNGLGRLEHGRMVRLTSRDGLFNDGVFQILEDDRGFLWMSSNRGIHRVAKDEVAEFAAGRRAEVTSIAYGKNDGLLNAECNGGQWPAGIRADDGRLWFPTQDGVAVIDPSETVANPRAPPVVIESVRIDREPVDPAAFDRPIAIGPGRRAIEIEYTGLDLTDPERVRFRYRLSDLDEQWNDAGTRRTAYYSHVPPGRYTFSVIAANSDGVWSAEPARLQIVVEPPFYRATWFLALVALGAIAAALAAHDVRVRRLKRADAAQRAFSRQLIESQERERKRIAAELHDSLGQSLAIIKNRALLSLSTPDRHDRAIEQLQEIVGASSSAMDEVREIAHNLRPYHLDRLGLTKALEGMIGRVAEAHDLPMKVEIDPIDGVLPADAEINLFRIVQEGVNNVVRHAGATEAAVRVRRNGRRIDVTIEDNGRGFTPGPPPSEGGMRGFGQVGMAERARFIGGTYRCRSAPGRGTIVTVVIDLPESS